MYFIYTILTSTGAVLLLPYFAYQRWRRGRHFHGLRERLGFFPARNAPDESGGAIWVHAVSVGEVLAAIPLAQKLKERFPDRRLLVSTTTPTGQELARQRMPFADAIFYFPLDWPGPVSRAFRFARPSLVVVVETEIWPNFLRHARRHGVPVVFVNGRLSERSFARYLRFRDWIGGVLERVLADGALYLMQSQEDAARIRELGAPEENVEVTGNMKYDVSPPAPGPLVAWLEAQVREQDREPVVVAGSVAAGEEEAVLAAFDVVQRKWRRALLVLAPRKPDHFHAAAELAVSRGWKVVRRSALSLGEPLSPDADVLLLDSLGELAALYRLAHAVFIGGSLVPVGGHNILEPAWFGKPPVFGPSMENFRKMAADFLNAGAAVQVADSRGLGEAWVALISDGARCEAMAAAARALVELNQGATQRTFDRLITLMLAPRSAA
jgi:3-deoxy-D-manno-octulosonic-acid transferase